MSNLNINYPELQTSSKSKVQAVYSAVLNKYRVTSQKEIEVKRGIEYNGKVDKLGANGIENKNVGWFKYYMTEKAFDTFTANNKTTLNIYLD